MTANVRSSSFGGEAICLGARSRFISIGCAGSGHTATSAKLIEVDQLSLAGVLRFAQELSGPRLKGRWSARTVAIPPETRFTPGLARCDLWV